MHIVSAVRRHLAHVQARTLAFASAHLAQHSMHVLRMLQPHVGDLLRSGLQCTRVVRICTCTRTEFGKCNSDDDARQQLCTADSTGRATMALQEAAVDA